MLQMNRPSEGWEINLWWYLEKSRASLSYGEFSHGWVVGRELKQHYQRSPSLVYLLNLQNNGPECMEVSNIARRPLAHIRSRSLPFMCVIFGNFNDVCSVSSGSEIYFSPVDFRYLNNLPHEYLHKGVIRPGDRNFFQKFIFHVYTIFITFARDFYN